MLEERKGYSAPENMFYFHCSFIRFDKRTRMPAITYHLITHSGQKRILLKFDRNSEWNNRIKKVPDARWSTTHKGWHIPATKTNLEKCGIKEERLVAAASQSKAEKIVGLSNNNKEQLQLYIAQMTLQKLSSSTITTYRNEFLQLLQLLKTKNVQDITAADLKRYMLYCTEKLKLSENTLHSRLNALKYYFEQILKQEKFFWEIPRPKKQLLLPKLFNQDEITAIIKAVGNLKHRTMLMLAYSSGLRVSEVVQLKTSNIDSKRMSILIEQAKGKKDRVVVLSPILLIMLREYWKKCKPSKNSYLFEGQVKGEPYSTRSLQLVLAAAKEKAGILKPGSIHALRHSFATHLLDKGTDVVMIMKLLGHNDIKTTLRYLHVSNRDMLQIISPLDDLKL